VKINEIYASIQGESTYAGLPCVFIRTTGCNLRCWWCDTSYAFYEGTEWALPDLLAKVRSFGVPLVELTGGEPLIQPEIIPLTASLLDSGFRVLIETGGSLPIDGLDPRAVVIMDIKCPGSGMDHTMCWANLEHLKSVDEVKFVIRDRADYLYAADIVRRHALDRRCALLFSPVFGELEPRRMAEWILADGLPVRLQLQQHKIIWEPTARGV
jgi:7-carboxy-7-deazaguanine synthase